ncbi:MAG: phosphatase PAP2 family protein [Haloarculaceae archaeon]
MSRGVGVEPFLAHHAGPLVVVFALLTQLGAAPLLFSLATAVYWLGPATPRLGDALDRERTATVLALLIGGVALTGVSKGVFALPRPPGATTPAGVEYVPRAVSGLYTWLVRAEGYGFPSGHAVTATVGWGGLAWAVRVGRRRTRALLAVALVALVSLSRLVLGVHYLVDVLAGAGVGLGLLALGVRLGRPSRVFVLVLGLAVTGPLALGVTRDGAAVLGLAAGGTLAWPVAHRAERPARRGALATLGLGVVTAGPLLVLSAWVLPTPGAALAGFAGGGLLIALPLVGDALERRGGRGPQNVSR